MIAAGTLIIDENGNALLFQKHSNNFYSLPFGKGEDGESPKETAIRETYEETGLKVRILDYDPFISLRNDGKQCYTFLAEVVSKDEIEIKEGTWKYGDPKLLVSGDFEEYNRSMLEHFNIF